MTSSFGRISDGSYAGRTAEVEAKPAGHRGQVRLTSPRAVPREEKNRLLRLRSSSGQTHGLNKCIFFLSDEQAAARMECRQIVEPASYKARMRHTFNNQCNTGNAGWTRGREVDWMPLRGVNSEILEEKSVAIATAVKSRPCAHVLTDRHVMDPDTWRQSDLKRGYAVSNIHFLYPCIY